MRYISIFSGIEAASVAWEPLGWEPVAFSEVDPFASAVLAYRYPDIPNLGDIREINWREVVGKYGAVDIVVGGSPCQSFSIAGGRESLDGESRLMYEYLRAIDEIRPRWLLWENVPGCLNTKDNAFGQLISALHELGYLDCSWSVLDAQFYGLAQRRRRVYVVGHLRASGYSSAAVLFDSRSLSGNTQTSGQKRASLARAAKGCAGASGEPVAFDAANVTRASDRSNQKPGDPSPTLHTKEPHIVCIADDNANATIDIDLCGSLKVGGGRPLIASSSAPYAPEITRE